MQFADDQVDEQEFVSKFPPLTTFSFLTYIIYRKLSIASRTWLGACGPGLGDKGERQAKFLEGTSMYIISFKNVSQWEYQVLWA